MSINKCCIPLIFSADLKCEGIKATKKAKHRNKPTGGEEIQAVSLLMRKKNGHEWKPDLCKAVATMHEG